MTTAGTCRSGSTPKVPAVTSVDDLLKPDYQGKVALDGDPTQAGAAFAGVVMVALAPGAATPDDVAPGVDFFGNSRRRGTSCRSTRPRPRSSRARPRWSSTGTTSTPPETEKLPSGRCSCPRARPVAGYYFQAISNDAVHPAAARFWQEFLYSDDGQNLWLAGGARPVRADAMVEAGTIDQAAYDALPRSRVTGDRQRGAERRGDEVPLVELGKGDRLSRTWQGTASAARPARALPLVPFLALVFFFLIIPTLTVVVASVYQDGVFSLDRVAALFSDTALTALWRSVVLSGDHGDHRRVPRRGAGLADREQPALVGVPPGRACRCAACWPSSAVWHWHSRSWPRSGSTAC